jgi:hypothetical protein
MEWEVGPRSPPSRPATLLLDLADKQHGGERQTNANRNDQRIIGNDHSRLAVRANRTESHTDVQEQRALLLMIARGWTQMAEQARRIRWAMSLLEVRRQT